jgi:hypothetical protein
MFWQGRIAAAVAGVLGGLAIPAAAAETPAPPTSKPALTTTATAPTTAPIDPATPKGALKSLALALEAGDRQAVLDLLQAESPAEQKIAAATADLSEATAALRQSATKAFGAQAARPLGVDASATPQAMARIDSSTVALDGAKATITSAQRDEPPLLLVQREGRWRVPVSEISREVDPAALEQNLKDAAEQVRLLKEIAGEVSAGKFKTAVEARQELDKRIMQSAMPKAQRNPATTAPAAATQPQRP